jgi:hypothetical protein
MQAQKIVINKNVCKMPIYNRLRFELFLFFFSYPRFCKGAYLS